MLIASLYQEAAIPAAHVDGKMTMRERDQILTDFSAGRIKVLTFVGIVEEGIDIPEASVVQFLRPTKSVRLRRQIEGRVRRPHPGKEGCLIIDHTNSWETLPLPDEDVEWDLKKPGESGVSRKGKGKPEKQPDGEVVMVEATFREITTATQKAHQRWVKPSWLRGALDGSIDYRDETLRRISRGDDPKWMVMKDLETDAGCTFEHFQLVGMALSYAPAWAHHAYRRVLSVRSMHRQKQEIQARLGSTMDAAWAAKVAAMPDIVRSMHEKPPHHLQAIGFDAEGKAVIAFGKEGQRSPIYLSQHADIRASLLKELQPAFPEGLVLLGLWQDLPLPEWDVAPSFEALV
jgi:hypothetical protein